MSCNGMFFKSIGSNSGGGGGNSDIAQVARKLSDGIVSYTPQDLKNSFYTVNTRISLSNDEMTSIKNLINLHESRINKVENDINNVTEVNLDIKNKINGLENNKGKILINNLDTLDYIENKVDKNTINIENNKLVVKTLQGLTVTIAELNMLQGVKSNIQSQINSLTKGMEYKGQVNTYADLSSLTNPQSGWTVIVKSDEKNSGKKMFYIYDDVKWDATYEVSSAIRDFTVDKLDLITESKGVLSDDRIDVKIARKTDLNNKIDRIALPQQDNVVLSNADGSLKSSGKTLNDFADKNHTHLNLETEINKKADKTELHNHTNKSTLDKLSESETGQLLFGGKLIEGGGSGTPTNVYTKDEIDKIVGKDDLLTTSKELKGAINELFINAYRGKELVANSIGNTDLATKTFAEISNSILSDKELIAQALANKGIISNKSKELKSYATDINSIVQNCQIKNTKLNIKNGETKQVVLANPTSIQNVCTSVLEYQAGGTNIVQYDCKFDNTDSTNFKYNDTIKFENGKMSQVNKVVDDNMNFDREDETGIYHNYTLNLKDFYKIESINNYEANLQQKIKVEGLHQPTLVEANGDISLLGVDRLTKMTWVGKDVKLIFSLDSGITWKTYDKVNKKNVILDKSNIENLRKGLSITDVNNLTVEDLNIMLNNSPKIRFGYYFEKKSINEDIYNDSITLTVDMKGKDVPSTNYTWNFATDGKTITYKFTKDNTYTIIYVDNA